MTALTTKQIIDYAMAWLPTRASSTNRNLLVNLRDMAISLLAPGCPPAQPVCRDHNVFNTETIIRYAMAWLPNQYHLTPAELLTQIRDATISLIQQLSKWKASMFFEAAGGGVDSSLNWASIDEPESRDHQIYTYDQIVRNGGDTLLFIAEKMFNNPSLRANLKAELTTAYQHGIRRLIVDLKNDNSDFKWENMEEYIKQMAAEYSWIDGDNVAFMTCLESNEVLSVAQVRQMMGWCEQYAPNKRVIVGSQSSDFLKAIGPGAELWLEIHTNPFELSQEIADKYLADLQKFVPWYDIWAGEYWDGSSQLSKQITNRAVEAGCAGTGSHVG